LRFILKKKEFRLEASTIHFENVKTIDAQKRGPNKDNELY
jgi:hypothetical protein